MGTNSFEGMTNKELAELFNQRMEYMYLMIKPELHYEYPNSFDGDCLKIAHELATRISMSEVEKNEPENGKNTSDVKIELTCTKGFYTKLYNLYAHDMGEVPIEEGSEWIIYKEAKNDEFALYEKYGRRIMYLKTLIVKKHFTETKQLSQ